MGWRSSGLERWVWPHGGLALEGVVPQGMLEWGVAQGVVARLLVARRGWLAGVKVRERENVKVREREREVESERARDKMGKNGYPVRALVTNLVFQEHKIDPKLVFRKHKVHFSNLF